MNSIESHFSNPVLAFDVPDPDVIALSAGGYAMVASSFDRRPGLPLWHSNDLVRWTPVGFAGGHAEMLHPSGGVWAPAIRERDGRLYITWADPDRGVFAVDAPAVAGPWSAPRRVIAGPGPIDPCPFWDDDGRAWIIHGWARSRAGFANRLDLVEVDPGLTHTVGSGRVTIDGDGIDGCTVLEGPKLYRRGAHYWVFAPAGGVETGWQYAFRSDSLAGPWESRIVLEQGGTEVNGPHQGAWVIGAAGEEWFLHFQHTPRHGRILHLQPLRWGEDDWPLIGTAVAGGPAEPVATWPHPTARPSTDEPVVTGAMIGWHGRRADPATIVEREDAGVVRLLPGGHLARPLDVDARRIAVTLLEGTGALRVFGAQDHGVRVVPSAPAPLDDMPGTHVVVTRLPAELAVIITREMGSFSVDGHAVGEPFTLTPEQWAGIDVAIGAEGTTPAVFDVSTIAETARGVEDAPMSMT